MDKTVRGAAEAIQGIESGMTIMSGGFGVCGIPEKCLDALSKTDIEGLTFISNDAGMEDFGLGWLLRRGKVKTIIASYVGENPECGRQILSGKLEVELTPQGTLAERCRAAQAGIPAFYTPAGCHSEAAKGKPTRKFGGKMHLMEEAFKADFAIVKAWQGDTKGNLIFRAAARNFNPCMCGAAKITIAEVEKLVPAGELDPDRIHIPGIFVNRIFEGKNYENRIEQRTVLPKPS